MSIWGQRISGSPYGDGRSTPKDKINSEKLSYLTGVVAKRIKMDQLEAAYQIDCKETLTAPSPRAIRYALTNDIHYSEPQPRHSGSAPFYSVDSLLKATNTRTMEKNAYNELIITGNRFHSKKYPLKGHLLLIEKYFLDKFNAEFASYPKQKSSLAIESIKILKTLEEKTAGRIKLALINTDKEGYYEKHSLKKQLKDALDYGMFLDKREKEILLKRQKLQESVSFDKTLECDSCLQKKSKESTKIKYLLELTNTETIMSEANPRLGLKP